MIKRFTTEFREGDLVQLKTSPGVMRIVTAYVIRGKLVCYMVGSGSDESMHRGFELERINVECVVRGFVG